MQRTGLRPAADRQSVVTSIITPDRQIETFKSRLIRDVGLKVDETTKVATLCAADVRFLPKEVKEEIAAASEAPVSARYEELLAFQAWSDILRGAKLSPPVVRAQVIVQNYICFIYLKDACFEVLARAAAPDSVVGRCSKYLCKSEVRDFGKVQQGAAEEPVKSDAPSSSPFPVPVMAMVIQFRSICSKPNFGF